MIFNALEAAHMPAGLFDRVPGRDSSAASDATHGVRLPPLCVGLLLVALAVSTMVLPLYLGLSRWTTWGTPGLERDKVSRSSRHLTSLDEWSFGVDYWPTRHQVAGQLRHGTLPLWDATSALGLPLAGRYESQVFFPLEWVAIFGGPRAWTVLLALTMVIGAAGTFLFLRRFVQSDLAALAGSIFYMFSAYFIWFYTIPSLVYEAMLVPWLFWAVEQCRHRERGLLRAVGVSGLVIGVVLLAGQPQVAFLSLSGCALYMLLVTLFSPRPRRWLLGCFLLGISVLLGVGIAAVQLGLFEEAQRVGSTLHPAGSATTTEVSALNFVTTLWPFLLGQFQEPWYSGVNPARLPQEGFPMLCGAFALFFLCLVTLRLLASLWRGKAHPSPETWSLFVLFAVVVMFLLPIGADRLWPHVGLGRVNFPRYVTALASFALAGLVAVGVQSLGWLTPRRLIGLNVVYVMLVAAVFFPVLHLIRMGAGTGSIDWAYLRVSMALSAVPFFVVIGLVNALLLLVIQDRLGAARAQLALLFVLAAEAIGYVRYGLALGDDALRLAVLLAVAGCGILIVRGWQRSIPFVIGGAFLATLLILQHAPYRLPEISDPYAATPPAHMNFLKQVSEQPSTGGRILATRPLLVPNFPASVGIPELAVNSPVQVGTTAWYLLNALSIQPLGGTAHYVIPNQWWGMTDDRDLASHGSILSWENYAGRRQYYNFLGVKYLVDGPDGWWGDHPQPDVDLVYQDAVANVYEDKRAMPRAYVVNHVDVVPDLTTARSALLDSAVDLRNRPIVEAGRIALPPVLSTGPTTPLRPVHIATYETDLVTLEANLERPGLLVLTDAYYPGWGAAVDNQPREVYRVNASVRGVVVPAGHHSITFRYRPSRLTAWLMTSLGSVALCALLCFAPSHPIRIRWSRTLMLRVLAVLAGVVAVPALMAPLRTLLSPHQASTFPAKVTVIFLGRTPVSIAGESSVVGPGGKPDVGFRLSVQPKSGTTLKIVSVSIATSDSKGRPAGGGRWDTYNEWVRALGIMRDGKVVNGGTKRSLGIAIGAPTVLDLYMDDGGMTSSWKYFVLKVEASGGYVYSTVLKSDLWRTIMSQQPAECHRSPQTPAFPGEIAVAFLGKTPVSIVGESGVVGPSAQSNVGFRLSVQPKRGSVLKISSVAIGSSDKAGCLAGGGQWDTFREGTRALGIMRDGMVVNAGAKRVLGIAINAPTALDFYIDDGGMTTFWKYFVLSVETAGGSMSSTILDRRTWAQPRREIERGIR